MMDKEILEVLFDVKDKRISVGTALEKLKALQKKELETMLVELEKETKEVIYSPIRFDGIHKNTVKRVFQSRGVEVNFF